jgi:hypothetical protein
MGQKMGFPSFTTNNQGLLHLAIEGVGELFIDVQRAHIFLYLLNKFPILNFKLISAAYIFCEEKAKHNFVTNPVLWDESALGFVVKIKKENFSPISLEGAVNQLMDMAVRLRRSADPFE